ncbi:hypothetical protein LQ318_14215 [Aliifodinibius salicampi]|uniref:Uncharacterized protein n=1 Tax=Fodinibius salicampi TaxID=1920655 RepID=A0ABT3Q223_9BACT|nr:hypothetical protein [Fodinibius salicampi]MCW9714063.1 hypothetical protein [Fodinibius salicampi]
MSSDSREERERLKEEYKAHYRKMRETKERMSRQQKTVKIAEALRDMDKSQMLEAFDDFLFSVKHKIASAEARLDMAMQDLGVEGKSMETQELDEQLDRAKAKETLKQLKMEMGMLYKEIEDQAGSIEVEKTIGPSSELSSKSDKSTTTDSSEED